ncbi:hypothetical protein KR009_002689 [Drosophila setifemur]|nr:hypothetical protein KR009_002689 [Drosophila setifemur]
MVPQAVKLLQTSLVQWRQGAVKLKLHPMAKGALTYAVMWPAGTLIQQTLEGKSPRDFDWARALRFSMFGALYVAPTLYGWVRLTSAMWPKTNLRTGIVKVRVRSRSDQEQAHPRKPLQAITEQLSYGPFACVSFFMGMSLLELKTLSEAIEETKEKAAPTYKVTLLLNLLSPSPPLITNPTSSRIQVGICIWPILQTINFSLVPEHNRVVFVSICSLMWTIFLAYMKTRHEEQPEAKSGEDLLPCT